MSSRRTKRKLRSRSKCLFGNSYMLEVCLAIGEADDRVNLTDLATRNALPPSMYSKPVTRLVELGLLVPASERPGDDYRVRWYRPAASTLWATAAELAE
jgi:hypothetical protein